MPDPDDPQTHRCRASSDDRRCDFRGTRHELDAHAEDVGHPRCIVCVRVLAWDERQTCVRCVTRVRDDLERIGVAFHRLPEIISGSAYRMTGLPGGDALVMVGGGAIEGGGSDDWLTDPSPVVIELHGWERDWRETFGHTHFPSWQATFVTVTGYLRQWLTLAARTHFAFDDFASEVGTLRSRVEHVAGLADDPEKAAAECFDCGGRLHRAFRSPTRSDRIAAATLAIRDAGLAVSRQRSAERTYGIAEHRLTPLLAPYLQREIAEPIMRGQGDEGLSDIWVCVACSRTYEQPEYYLALRAAAETEQGYVPLAEAARAAKVPGYLVRNWYDRGQLGGYCQVFPKHRHMVWWPDVHDRVSARSRDRITAV